MIHAGQALSILGEPETDHHRAKRFKSLLAGLAAQGRIHNFVAAPFARARLPSTSPKMLKLGRCWTARKTIAVESHCVHEMLKLLGISMNREGKPVTIRSTSSRCGPRR